MKEDRSWIVPLAFLAFGGILITAIFFFLRLKNLLTSSDGMALVSWLTLVVTACAFAAALSALFIALKQIGHDETQAKISEMNELKSRIAQSKKASQIWRMIELTIMLLRHSMEADREIPEDYFHQICRNLEENHQEFRELNENDYHMDIFPEQKTSRKIIESLQTIRIYFINYYKSNKRSEEREIISRIYKESSNASLEIRRTREHSNKRIQELYDRINELAEIKSK